MVRALLAGQKTQTRRPMKPIPTGETVHGGEIWPLHPGGGVMECQLAASGEILWVREPFAHAADGLEFEADVGPAQAAKRQWRPGRFLARPHCRRWLRVTRVWPQRLQAMTASEAEAEGFPPALRQTTLQTSQQARDWFRDLWDSIYGTGELAGDLTWQQNPWVWAIEFKLLTKAPPGWRESLEAK